MKFHKITKNGHREEVSAAEYLKLPICRREKFMQAVEEVRERKAAERQLKLHSELETNARAGLKLVGFGSE